MKALTARVILIRTQRLVKMKKKLNKMKKKSEISNLLKRKQTILVYLKNALPLYLVVTIVTPQLVSQFFQILKYLNFLTKNSWKKIVLEVQVITRTEVVRS